VPGISWVASFWVRVCCSEHRFQEKAGQLRGVCVAHSGGCLLIVLCTGRSTPRAYQDERFSYVVLRRSPRPADAPELSIRRQLNSHPELDPDQYRSEPNALNTSRARRLVR